jgi:F-type H+-transporting ATPase subunit b
MTEHGTGQPTPWDLIWPTPVVANFLIFVFLLVYYLRGPAREYFRARTARLREALAAGARARSEAESLRAELARAVREMPALRERLRADVRTTAEEQRRAILELGARAAERIRSDARVLAEQEVVAAREALRAEVVEEAVRQATVLIRAAMRPEDQERLVGEFVTGAGASA